jgi:hypothetical protein
MITYMARVVDLDLWVGELQGLNSGETGRSDGRLAGFIGELGQPCLTLCGLLFFRDSG